MRKGTHRLAGVWFIVCFCLAVTLEAVTAADRTGSPPTNGANRVLEFKGDKSLGVLFVAFSGERYALQDLSPTQAKGKVSLAVPKGDKVVFSPNGLLMSDPKLLANIPSNQIDAMRINVVELDESEKGKCDRFVAALPKYCKNLRELVLDDSDVTDDGIAKLHDMPNLESISTESCNFVRGRFVKALVTLPRLHKLVFRSHPMDDQGLKQLASLPQLKFLGLRGTGIGADGVKMVSRCPQLQDLDLSNNNSLSDKAITYLPNLKHLRRLSLAGTPVSDLSMPAILQCHELRDLDLLFTAVSARGFALLKPMHLDVLRVGKSLSKSDVQKIGPLAKRVLYQNDRLKKEYDLSQIFMPQD